VIGKPTVAVEQNDELSIQTWALSHERVQLSAAGVA
jgi:hypothetical protein